MGQEKHPESDEAKLTRIQAIADQFAEKLNAICNPSDIEADSAVAQAIYVVLLNKLVRVAITYERPVPQIVGDACEMAISVYQEVALHHLAKLEEAEEGKAPVQPPTEVN